MITPPLFSGFDGLMTLSRREGVDIRPTLLRVLTDLYVQAGSHTADEQRQFVELSSRLIGQVDDATRAVVRARLAIYPHTPAVIAAMLGIGAAADAAPASPPLAPDIETEAMAPAPAGEDSPPPLAMLPDDAAQISAMFFAATSRERTAILDNLAGAPLKPAPPIPAARARRAIETLEMAAFASDVENFTLELGEALILPARMAAQVVNDPGGEPLACALRALGMTADAYQRVLLFLDPATGGSVTTVYRLARLYDRLTQHGALVLLAAWRGAMMPAARAKYRPLLHDDERHRARGPASRLRGDLQQPAADAPARPKHGGD